MSPISTVAFTPDSLRLAWRDGLTAEYPSLWLRDNCPPDRDAGSGQRLVDVADLPAAPRIRAAAARADGVVVEWESDPRPVTFDPAWLARHAPGAPAARPERQLRLWPDGAALDAGRDFAWATHASLAADDAARLAWLTRLAQDGLAFVRAMPGEPGAILEAAALLGFVLETNYGRLFDVRSVARPENLAYSDHGLGLHTDNPYREPVPGFQALHVLAASPDGGDSVFADGHALAAHLRATEPETFATLTRTPVPFLYQSKDADLYAERPLIQLAADGTIGAVHYNNRSVAPLPPGSAASGGFYAAYRRFALLLREPRFQLRTKLLDGDMVVFDNQRTLHGRTAFSSARHPRHLQGCYLTRDSVLSRIGLLRRSAAERIAP